MEANRHALFFAVGLAPATLVLFGALAQVHQQRGVAAVVQDQVGAFAFAAGRAKVENAVGVVPVIGQCLALDREHRRARWRQWRRRRGPAWRRCCRMAQRTWAPRACSVSISTAVWMVMCSEPVMRAPFKRLLGSEFLADGHQAGHFGFGDADFLAAPFGQADVGNDAIGVDRGVDACVHGVLQSRFEKPLDAGEKTSSPHD
jgi:hypothetical protein